MRVMVMVKATADSMEDFGDAMTPDLKEQEQALRQKLDEG